MTRWLRSGLAIVVGIATFAAFAYANNGFYTAMARMFRPGWMELGDTAAVSHPLLYALIWMGWDGLGLAAPGLLAAIVASRAALLHSMAVGLMVGIYLGIGNEPTRGYAIAAAFVPLGITVAALGGAIGVWAKSLGRRAQGSGDSLDTTGAS